MEAATLSISALRAHIAATEQELLRLKSQLLNLEKKEKEKNVTSPSKWPLSSEEYKRYGRQMIVPSIGLSGQLKLKSSKLLIIGAGGLGCPAAAYLAGAGIGTLGIVDGDVVEVSNLHRQILHSGATVGMAKVESAVASLTSLNSNVKYVAYKKHISPGNAEEIVKGYDLVLDCTDNPASRYLISDICVLLSKPLISASALRTDGQLILLNAPSTETGDGNGERGPCYRCIFPKPPPADTVVSCGEGGILGPVVGVLGVLQALEAVRFLVGGEKREEGNSMLTFSAASESMFRRLKMRGRRKGCVTCSEDAKISLDSLRAGSLDYEVFCGLNAPVSILEDGERVSAREFVERRDRGDGGTLVDVREKVQFDICHIEGSVNVPFSRFCRDRLGDLGGDKGPVTVVCRLGNDSQVVVRRLREQGWGGERWVGDIKGGLRGWREEVDGSWPDY